MTHSAKILIVSLALLGLVRTVGFSQGFSGFGLYAEGGFSKGYEPLYYPEKWNYLIVPKFEVGIFTSHNIAPRVFLLPELNYKFFGEKRRFSEPFTNILEISHLQRAALGMKGEYYFREDGTQIYGWGGIGLGINTKANKVVNYHLPDTIHIRWVDMGNSMGRVQSNFRFGLGAGKIYSNGVGMRVDLGTDCIVFKGGKPIPFYPCWIGRITIELKKKRGE